MDGEGEETLCFFVRQGRISAVIRTVRIGGAHPGGASLGGTVQKDFHAAQLKSVVIDTPAVGQGVYHGVGLFRVRIAYNIEFEQIAVDEGTVQRDQLRRQHPFLEGGDAVGRIFFLGADVGRHQILCRGHGNFLQEGDEGVFLQIAGRLSVPDFDATAQRTGSVGRNAEKFQGGGVKNAHVARLMLDYQGIVRGGLVQQGSVRMGAFPEAVVVVALARDPDAGRNFILKEERADLRDDFRKIRRFLQRNLQKGTGVAGKMAVGIQKGGEHGRPLQVHKTGTLYRIGKTPALGRTFR